MKLLLEIKDSEANFIVKLLKSLSAVKKVQQVKPRAAELLREGLKEAKLHREGKIELPDAEELFKELAMRQHED